MTCGNTGFSQMEAKFGRNLHRLCEPVVSDLNGVGKRSIEWDLNEWRWDGDFLRASPLNPVPSDCSSRHPFGPDIPVKNASLNFLASSSVEAILEDGREKRDSEKRRRYIDVNEEHENGEAGSLDLMLGDQVFPIVDKDADKSEKSGKKSNLCGEQSSRAVCQVEGCRADLSSAKDYHRRHKVCDVHSKASTALVGSIMQRFCQQCSRFHVLEEFDEGKRSCRRRLAGHNKRRRKAHPENAVGSTAVNDEQRTKYLLISLLRILSNIQSSSSDQTKDQDLLAHLLRNLATVSGSTNISNPNGLLPVSPDLQNAGTSCGKTIRENGSSDERPLPLPQTGLVSKDTLTDSAQVGAARVSTALCNAMPSAKSIGCEGRVKMSNIDLNNVYDDSEDCTEDLVDNIPLENVSPYVSPWSFKDSQRSSPPQSQSPSTSSGEAQSRTDRIVFKLFGKDPSDFPLELRKQMIDWLSSSPSDIESYIRPGCIILTIYACMDKSSWDELNCNLHSSLKRLLDASSNPFWTTDWIYTRVQHRASFVYNGQVVLDMPVHLRALESCRISMISPIAVSFSETVHFSVKGYNLSGSTSRLLCALEGRYILQQSCADVVGADSYADNGGIQCLQFSCAVPHVVGRGFIEVEDYCLNSSFFPFIVAEKDVCAAICDLEKIIDVDSENLDPDKTEARNQALNFVHEMGWLLHKNSLILRVGAMRDDVDLFSFRRFKYLIEFAIDHGWPAVVRKLLNVVFDGTVDMGKGTSAVAALLDLGLLHRAARTNSIPVVKLLLEYRSTRRIADAHKQTDCSSFLFMPDSTGPCGLTPLHIAAGLDDAHDLIDALTEDPQSVGIGAWNSVRDHSGLTPHDYACLRGHYSYTHLVQKKQLSKKHGGHVVIDVPGTQLDVAITKQKMAGVSSKMAVFRTEKTMGEMMSCSKCEQMMSYGSPKPSVALYRPAMLSMVLIAAVCVCAALLFKSSPEVVYLFRPFRWELLKYGAE